MANVTRHVFLALLLLGAPSHAASAQETLLDVDRLRSVTPGQAASLVRAVPPWRVVRTHIGATPEAQLIFCYGPEPSDGGSLPQATLFYYRGALVLADVAWSPSTPVTPSLLRRVFNLPEEPPAPTPTGERLAWRLPFGYVSGATIGRHSDGPGPSCTFARVDLADAATRREAVAAFFGPARAPRPGTMPR